jgi:DMSO/TMAO reductase YedYZ heme-binding membrane subunit
MDPQLRPDEAASALAEIRLRQERVIDAVLVPTWYWWAVAAGAVAIGAAADSHARTVLAVTLPVAIVEIATLTVVMIFGTSRQARVRGNELLGGRGAIAIVAFVWILVGLSLGAAFALRAAGAPLPGTIGTALCALGLVTGGPLLMRRLRKIMLGNRAGLGR